MKRKVNSRFGTGFALKLVDRIGATILIGAISFGAKQVRSLYLSVDNLSQNVATLTVEMKHQSDDIKELKGRVRFLEVGGSFEEEERAKHQ